MEPSLGSVASYGVGQRAWGLVGFLGMGLASGAFRRGASVPIFNLATGLPLEAATVYVKAAVALGDALAAWVCLSAGRTSSRLCRWELRWARLWGCVWHHG